MVGIATSRLKLIILAARLEFGVGIDHKNNKITIGIQLCGLEREIQPVVRTVNHLPADSPVTGVDRPGLMQTTHILRIMWTNEAGYKGS